MSYPRIVYGDIAEGAAEASSVSVNGHESISNPSLVPFGSEDSHRITLEHNGWMLNGTKDTVNGSPSYWSSVISDEQGSFSTMPQLTITLSALFSTSGLTFEFDQDANEWPSEMVVTFYQNSTVIKNEILRPTKPFFTWNSITNLFNKLVVQFHKTSMPLRRIRLNKIAFGITYSYDQNDIISCTMTEELSLISNEIVINSLKTVLAPREEADLSLQRKQAVSLFEGSNLIGKFYLSEGAQRGSNIVELVAQDAIGLLDTAPFPATLYNSTTVYAALNTLLSGYNYEIDSSLTDTALNNVYIPAGTKRSALHHLAFAGRALVDARGGTIRIFRAKSSVTSEFDSERVYVGGTVKRNLTVTAVRMWYHSLSSGSGSIEINGTKYSDTTGYVDVINELVDANEPENVLEFKDCTCVTQTAARSIAQWVLDTMEASKTEYTAKMLTDGEKVGDVVTALTPMGDIITGTITKADTVFSGVTAANVTIKGGIG